MSIKLKFHFTSEGLYTGTSKTGKPFYIQQAYVFLEDSPYPVRSKFFVNRPFSDGLYSVEASIVVDREELKLSLNFDNAQRLADK